VSETASGRPRALSPCIGVCRMDWEGRYCLGCGRTIQEIARWLDMSVEERVRVLEALPERRPPVPRR
jgi:predicted Fe-S protein YdhL (DUF1289 family)